jgi:hypothetical protein
MLGYVLTSLIGVSRLSHRRREQAPTTDRHNRSVTKVRGLAHVRCHLLFVPPLLRYESHEFRCESARRSCRSVGNASHVDRGQRTCHEAGADKATAVKLLL